MITQKLAANNDVTFEAGELNYNLAVAAFGDNQNVFDFKQNWGVDLQEDSNIPIYR